MRMKLLGRHWSWRLSTRATLEAGLRRQKQRGIALQQAVRSPKAMITNPELTMISDMTGVLSAHGDHGGDRRGTYKTCRR